LWEESQTQKEKQMHTLMGSSFFFAWFDFPFENMVSACHQKNVMIKQGKN